MRTRRGVALIAVLLATTLVLVILAFVVNIGTSQLRRTTEELWEMQAQAGADGAVGWVRALLAQRQGDIPATLADIAAAHNTYAIAIDADTSVQTFVAVRLATPGNPNDHLDVALQHNPYVNETPLQVTVTAAVTIGGATMATRSTTALVRVFRQMAPYSEVVGFIDNSGPVGVESPGDPAGQAGGTNATDLRIHVFTQIGSGEPVPADSFADQHWSDGNVVPVGPLP